jgi:hypothetical protein
MVIEWAVAVGRRGSGKIERAQKVGTKGRADHLHHIGIGTLLLPRDLGSDGADVGTIVIEGVKACTH